MKSGTRDLPRQAVLTDLSPKEEGSDPPTFCLWSDRVEGESQPKCSF